MSTSMLSAQGTVIAVEVSSVYTTIAEVQNFGWGHSRDIIDKTAIDDTVEVVSAGLRRGADLSLDGGLDPSDPGQDGLKAAYTSGTATNFRITCSDESTTRIISCIVTAYNETGAVNDKHGFSATLKIVGVCDLSEE